MGSTLKIKRRTETTHIGAAQKEGTTNMISPVTFTPITQTLHVSGAQPNEFDLRRLKRMLEKRDRYRYVTVSITPTISGYLITSPCCSPVSYTHLRAHETKANLV